MVGSDPGSGGGGASKDNFARAGRGGKGGGTLHGLADVVEVFEGALRHGTGAEIRPAHTVGTGSGVGSRLGGFSYVRWGKAKLVM